MPFAPQPSPATDPGELLHDGRFHRIHRRRGGDGQVLIVKSLAAGGIFSSGPLENERRILERLQRVEGCPDLLPCDELGQTIAMRDFGGVQLDASGLMGRLDLGKFLILSEKLARIVTAIHEQGIIHRAIEPAHILVRAEDLALEIVGFGSASTFVEEASGDWKPRRSAENPLWIAPEQTGRMNRAVDWRADLYSLGAVLYALATGKPPFQADSIGGILYAHLARLPEPPTLAVPCMPANLERIILKLLAKEPDERYQGAASLAHDLGLLRQALALGRPMEEILLPPSDIPARPRLPSRLHGRTEEFQRLADALENVRCGGSRQIFVAGRSGTGKSSLLQELQRPTALAKGFFVSGKCEQFGQGKAFHAPAMALDRLARLLLDGTSLEIELLRERLSKKLAAGAELLCAVAPALVPLLGTPQRAEEFIAPEAQMQLVGLTVDFLSALCSPEHPLVLVLDDLQWADAPTLALLKRLQGETRLEGFLLVGAYRDDEVGPSHPLAALLQRTGSSARSRDIIPLENLGTPAIASLLGEMLGSMQPELHRLAEMLLAKTGGNPHFTVQMVELLWSDGTLKADAATAKWLWDTAAIQGGGVTSNVADLLARDLGSLPPPTQELLCAMACLGSESDLAVLALATAMDLRQVAAVLEPALALGVLVTSDALSFQHLDATARLRFCHDRMQQAALRANQTEEFARRSLEIARRLSTPPGRADLEPRAAWCYAHALDLLAEKAERTSVRRVFLRVAEASLASGDYKTAENHLRQAVRLLPSNAPKTGYRDFMRIHTNLHLACYCRGAYEEADGIFKSLQEAAEFPRDLAPVACIQVMSLSNRTRYQEAVGLGSELAAQLLGVALPYENPEPALREEMAAFRKLAEAGGLEGLEGRTASADAGWSLAARLLNRMIPAAFFTSPQFAFWLALRCGREWLEHGYRPAFLYPMSCVGLASMALDNDFSTGWRAAAKALQIGKSRERGVETARSEHVFGLFSCHWFEPLENALAHARSAFETLSRTDELEFACYTFFTSQAAVFDTGAHLDAVRREVQAAMDFVKQTGNLHASQSFLPFQQAVRALEGVTAMPGGFDDDGFREEAHLAEIAMNPMARAFFHTYRSFTACIFHDVEALDHHAEAAAELTPYITGFYPTALASFLHSLALVERLRKGWNPEETVRRLAQNQRWLLARAIDQPGNFAHLHDLVEAERLDAAGDSVAAMAMFEKVRGQAMARQRPWHLAIATERAARCFERHGLSMASRPLFAEVLALHQQLGAHGKAADMVAKWPFLNQSSPVSGDGLSAQEKSDHTLAGAFQSLAAQMSIQDLAERSAHWLAEFTGATDVRILALDSEDRWLLQAGLSNGNPVAAMPRREAEQKGLVSRAALSLCEVSSSLLVSSDAKGDGRFLRDPYFVPLHSCSLLAVPISIHSKIRALVVLENRLVRSAFHPGLVEAARMLCGQLALCIGSIRSRQSLEKLVDERTEELKVSREREKSLAHTAYELTENILVGTYVFELNETGVPQFTFLSERLLAMIDLRREELLANPSLGLQALHPDDREEFRLRNIEAFATSEILFWEGRLLVRGQTRWATIESIPRRRKEGGAVWEGVLTDITVRKEAELREREREKAHSLELRTKLKTALTASAIAHEIDQPLSRVIHTADLVRMHAGDVIGPGSKLSKFIAALSVDARHTAVIISKMKALLRNVKTQHERIDLAECLRDAILYNAPRVRAREVEIVLEEPEGEFPVQGDAVQVNIALNNILENAAQAMAAQAGPGAREIRVQLLRHPAEIEIRIGDTGPGIAAADIPELLLRSTKAEGAGVGLFIAQATMENHSGRLEITRSELGGAEFRMVFPSREPRAESREPRAESREPRAESREPRAESREPRAESREPRAESREPRAESREPERKRNEYFD